MDAALEVIALDLASARELFRKTNFMPLALHINPRARRKYFVYSTGFTMLKSLGIILLIAIIISFVFHSPEPFYDSKVGAQATSSNTTPLPRDTSRDKYVVISKLNLDFTWKSGGFGSVMVADFKVKNDNTFAVKDLKVECSHFAKSGTKIDSNTREVFDLFPAGKSTTAKGVNMGLIHSQVESSACRVTDFSFID